MKREAIYIDQDVTWCDTQESCYECLFYKNDCDGDFDEDEDET